MGVVVKEKNQSNSRWVILALTCVMLVANYYCYDIPAALHQQLSDYMGNADNHFETYFQLLYTLYSVPNVILPFFGGYFVDKWGVRTCLILFMSFLVIGQTIFSIGVSKNSWTWMFIGRILYGFGGESLGVANSAILSEWFKGKELAFAFGLNLSIARLGSVANNFSSPRIAAADGIQFACWFGVILTGLGLLVTLAISVVDKRFETSLKDDTTKALITENDNEDGLGGKSAANDDTYADADQSILDSLGGKPPPPEMRDVLKFSQAFWLLALSCVVVYGCVLPFNNIASTLLLERSYFVAPESDCALVNPDYCESAINVPLSTCVNYYASTTNQPPLPAGNTTATINCNSYTPVNGVYSGCYGDYCTRLIQAENTASATMSIPYFISASLSPFLGAAVDRFGQRAVIAAISPAVLIVVHLTLGLTTVNPIYPLVGQGLAYASFAAVLWPSVPLVIEQRFVGLGFGIVTSVQNAGLASFPLIVAAIYSSAGNHYIPKVEMFFVSLASLGFLVGLYLNYYDYHHNRVFNSPGDHGAKALADKEGGRTLSTDPQSGTLVLPGDHHAGDRAAKEHTRQLSRGSVDRTKNGVFTKVNPAV